MNCGYCDQERVVEDAITRTRYRLRAIPGLGFTTMWAASVNCSRKPATYPPKKWPASEGHLAWFGARLEAVEFLTKPHTFKI